MEPESTIAAISTPPGEGGIGIVRLSGPEAVKITSAVFKPAGRGESLPGAPSHTFRYGHIVSNGKAIDEVLVNVMKAPATYTREDVVEINCHGGIIPLKQTLSLVISLGARLAEPGEFTARAFLNGRIDLSQAEAVADIISARTEAAGEIALSHLKGELKDKVEILSLHISHLLADVEASIEFPDEDTGPARRESLTLSIEGLLDEIHSLLSTGDFGKILREGLNLAIAGIPNVGKSSLFNALTGENRVIVTHIAGTTRDIVESTVSIGGIPVALADTAGIDENAGGIIEKEASKRSSARAESADFIILVLDGSCKTSPGDMRILGKLRHRPMVIAVNKSDLPREISHADIRKTAGADKTTIDTSAVTGEGLDELRETIAEFAGKGAAASRGSIIVANRRHIDALEKTAASLEEAKSAAREAGEEIIALTLKSSLDSLGEITGKTTNEAILSDIFSRFCIGK